MKKVALVIILCFVVAGIAFAGANSKAGVGPTHEVNFSSPTRVGADLLPAGSYQVQHVMEQDKHIMVFTGNGKAVRVECKMVNLKEKAPRYTAVYRSGDKGERILTSLTFQGEMYEHAF